MCSSAVGAAGLGHEDAGGGQRLTASSSWQPREPPLGRRAVWRCCMQQKHHLALSLASLLLCVSMNLLSPVLQGMLFDVLVRGQPWQQ